MSETWLPIPGWIEFAGNEEGFDQVPDTGLVGGNPLPVRGDMARVCLKASRRRREAAAIVDSDDS
ncbi:MAG: hypothetical protein ACLP3C_03770 [Mycobacterium sp.]|uniref:hypothetical protein n=1 Tax=Mycobacterium sp. TaxID=1785 RepID=UPI003F9553F8